MDSVIVIIQHDENDGPCYFGVFLRDRKIPYVLFRMFVESERALLPSSVGASIGVERQSLVDEEGNVCTTVYSPVAESGTTAAIAGVASLGGFMSANDNLPYFETVFALYRSAIECDVPVIGHCLGAQLLSCALGGTVVHNVRVELGWTRQKRVHSSDPEVKDWFGPFEELEVFHWHGETFSIPEHCHLLVTGPDCANQAFQYKDKYVIGMQFHVEVDYDKIEAWIAAEHPSLFEDDKHVEEILRDPNHPSQPHYSHAAMTKKELLHPVTHQKLEYSRDLADEVYSVWIQGLRKV